MSPSKRIPGGREQRAHRRQERPILRLKIGAKTYRSHNWSLGGILVDAGDDNLTPGSLLSITELGRDKDKMTSVSIKARIVRADPETGRLAVSFLEIDRAAYAVLHGIAQRQ